mmetsp:Transcript_18147/g.20941  ORF Transcript_18147/g.20941 Transcript_18147/m.20941 type:complete len:88 (+) Transcript_18147:1-264(+)
MKKANDIFIINRDPTKMTLTLAPAEGDYSLEIFESNHAIDMQTPISGKFSYVLDTNTKEWVNQVDGHSLEGLFVRDLIKQCNGIPKL